MVTFDVGSVTSRCSGNEPAVLKFSLRLTQGVELNLKWPSYSATIRSFVGPER